MQKNIKGIESYAGVSIQGFWEWLNDNVPPHLKGKDEDFFLRLFKQKWLDTKWDEYRIEKVNALCDRIYKERKPEAYDYCVISFNYTLRAKFEWIRNDLKGLADPPYFYAFYEEEGTHNTRMLFVNVGGDPEFYVRLKTFYYVEQTPGIHSKIPHCTGNAIGMEYYPVAFNKPTVHKYDRENQVLEGEEEHSADIQAEQEI